MDTSDSSSSSVTDKAPEFVSINPEHVTYACKVLHARLTHKPAAGKLPFKDVRCAVGQKFFVCITWTKPRRADAEIPPPVVPDVAQGTHTEKLQAFIPPEIECRGFVYATSRKLSRAIEKAALKTDGRFAPIQLEELRMLTCSLELLRDVQHLIYSRDYQPHLRGVLLKAPLGPLHRRSESDEKGCRHWPETLFLKEVPFKHNWTYDDTLREFLQQLGHVQGKTYDCDPGEKLKELRGATLKTFTTSSYSARWCHLPLSELDLVQRHGAADSPDPQYEFVPSDASADEDSEPDDEVDENFLVVASIANKSAPFDDAEDDDAEGEYELAKTLSR